MRIAIFTDIHGNKPALEAILEDIKKENIDEIICLGDTISLGPCSQECLDLLIENKVNMILGNHELIIMRGDQIKPDITIDEVKHNAWLNENINNKYLNYLKKCPLYIEREYHGKKVLFSHFLIKNANNQYPYYSLKIMNNDIKEIVDNLNYDYIFIGHDHNKQTINNKLYDIGSSGCREDSTTMYTIFNTDSFEIITKELQYDRKKLVEAIKNTNYQSRKLYAKWFFNIEV